MGRLHCARVRHQDRAITKPNHAIRPNDFLVGQSIAAGMAQHVDVNLERETGALTNARMPTVLFVMARYPLETLKPLVWRRVRPLHGRRLI